MHDEIGYVCPRSRESLMSVGEHLVGPSGTRYPVVDGVPRFLARPPAETPDVARGLERMLARARVEGWKASLTDHPDPGYLMSEARTRYVELLPLGPRTRVLEVGCSLGQGTSAIARRAGSVEAVEVVAQQAAFARERFRQEGLGNVQVCAAGDDCLLPFPAAAFDVAVLNLVLEWCAQRDGASASCAQRRLLAEVARTLRPGGALFLATKNRFGLQYVTGGPDEHVGGLRFGNALPRRALELLMRARGPVDPRGTLHSFGCRCGQ